MQERGVETAGAHFRAYIPVNMRPPSDEIKLGNRFGLVYLTLPVGTVDQVERFQLVKERMDELKGSTEAEVAITLLTLAGMLPKDVENFVFQLYHAKATAVLTNVPGPQQPLYLAGARLRSIMGWVPQAGSLSIGISMLSYNGELLLGINTDSGLVPDPERIIEHFHVEIEGLRALAIQVN
jgi:hypothetical protein